MSEIATSHSRPTSGRQVFLGAALLCALGFFLLNATLGIYSLWDARGDHDSLLRLVQVRDLLHGQSWFDPTQYRMGPEGGFAMHWSRLVDLPIVAVIALLHSAGLNMPWAEMAALVTWPLLLFIVSVYLIIRAAHALAGERAVLPAAAVGAGALHYTSIFPPGALDHHNIQLVLTLTAVVSLLEADASNRKSAIAGVSAALMLAIGMETAPYVAVTGAFVATRFLVHGRAFARETADFGFAFAGVAAAAFFLTVRPADWFDAQCDAFSSAQLSVATIGGGGLGLMALTPALGLVPIRAAALGSLAVVIATLVAFAFPQCLAAPYAELDPRLIHFWLSIVPEARSFGDILVQNPKILLPYYATPIIAGVALAMRIRSGGYNHGNALIGTFLAAAFIVSLWQQRGAMFSLPVAAIVLATWIASLREAAVAFSSANLRLAVVWLFSFSHVWAAGSSLMASAVARGVSRQVEAVPTCYRDSDFAKLATLPSGNVVAISNLGAAILAHTPHRVFSGPYHRNVAGNLAALDILMGSPETVEARAREIRADYVALCRGNPETGSIIGWAPQSLLATLVSSQVPGWLEPVSGTSGEALEIYRVTAPRP
jgi:hypothetical protein